MSTSSLRAMRLPRRIPSLRRPFTDAAASPANKVQVYISQSRDPFLNLSIEHVLLQKSHPASTVLFLYTNRPSIVIGRNQNPWVEVNLPLLEAAWDSCAAHTNADADTAADALLVRTPQEAAESRGVALVRRRSGGGAVFHDSGNINFSVVCPSAAFDRDRHAEMVVRALTRLGVAGALVNCRHDIIVAGDDPAVRAGLQMTPAGTCKAGAPGTFKVSGSAYKLTRQRSLHHGTCLLGSPNLKNISRFLRSPARSYIEARGVESVRSPVKNVDVDRAAFETAVLEEFAKMYGAFEVTEFNESLAAHPEVAKGMKELKSRDWIYGQTPRFSFSSDMKKEGSVAAENALAQDSISFEAAHGELEAVTVNGSLHAFAQPKKLYDIKDWPALLSSLGIESAKAQAVGTWTGAVLGSSWSARGETATANSA